MEHKEAMNSELNVKTLVFRYECQIWNIRYKKSNLYLPILRRIIWISEWKSISVDGLRIYRGFCWASCIESPNIEYFRLNGKIKR